MDSMVVGVIRLNGVLAVWIGEGSSANMFDETSCFRKSSDQKTRFHKKATGEVTFKKQYGGYPVCPGNARPGNAPEMPRKCPDLMQMLVSIEEFRVAPFTAVAES
jgi:hypothetical protein